MDVYNVFCGKPIKKTTSFFSFLKSKVFNETVVTCSTNYLCINCKKHRSKLCQNYHLNSRPVRLVRDIEYYLKKLPEEVIKKVATIGSMDVERDMRDYYEKLYIVEPDSNHQYFKTNILAKSPLSGLKNDYALSGNNYWYKILYLVLQRLYQPSVTYLYSYVLKLNLDSKTLIKKIPTSIFSSTNNLTCYNTSNSITSFFIEHAHTLRNRYEDRKRQIDIYNLDIDYNKHD